MNEKKWFLMEHEEYGTRAAYVILSEEGAVVMNDCYNGFDEEARRNIQNFMQQQAEQAQHLSGLNTKTRFIIQPPGICGYCSAFP